MDEDSQVDEVVDDEDEVAGKKSNLFQILILHYFKKCLYISNVRFLLTDKYKNNGKHGRKGCISHIRESAYDNHFPN